MPITSVTSDPHALTLTVVGDYPVPVERLWEAYADPRQLERFWGPPEWPATFTRHDMVAGGRSHYYMTGPDGTKAGGWWSFLSIDPMQRIELEDGFSDEDGEPSESMPTMRMTFTFEPVGSGSRFIALTRFPSTEAMQKVIEMGMAEGLRAAMGQLDDVLADLASFAAGRRTDSQILSDTKVRFTRIIRGSVEQVWRAYHEPELLRRWMLGPDGWTMPVCEVAKAPGERFRYEWVDSQGGNRFGFEGEILEMQAPNREVATEQLIGQEGDPSINDLTLTPVAGGTLMSLVITYPSMEVRDIVLGTGMLEGMEQSYARLESELLVAAVA